MGSVQSATTVSVLAEGETPGPFAIRRCPNFEKGVYQNPPEFQTMQDILLYSYKQFANNPYIGCRKRNANNELENVFTFKTYKECEELAYRLGSGLINLGIPPKGFIGIYSENRPEWIHMIDDSCLYGHAIMSLYDTFGLDSLAKIIESSKMDTIMVSTNNAPKLIKILKSNTYDLKNIILFTEAGRSYESLQESFQSCDLSFFTFDEILQKGEERQPIPKVEPDWIHYICYSSGTTGTPKGVIISHRSQCSNTLNCKWGLKFGEHTHHLSYLPLPHVFERIGISVTSCVGGRIGIFSGSIKRLTEDMQILQPTHLSAVPRVINKIYDNVMENINQFNPIKKGVFWGMFYWKRFWLKRGYASPLADALVFNQINSRIGGHIESFIVGGAAMDPWIHEFIQFATGAPMRVGYGLSEIGAGNIVNPMDVRYSKPGTVGGPMCNCEVRLEPLEDYDDPECGEIIMGGQCNCSGYLYDEQSTRNLFIDEANMHGDGGAKGPNWIHTGDVGKWDQDGYLMVIDRMRSIFKLSQGEYVAAELLTQTYEMAPIVSQIFIYGDSTRTCLVAIVVPDKNGVAAFRNQKSLSDDEYRQACQSPELNKEIISQLEQIAKERNLPGYEKIRAVAIETEEWTSANSMVTPTFKLKRKNLAEKYKATIDQLYQTLG